MGDASPHTAMGVFMGMKAAVEQAYGDWTPGIRVAVQGVGNVGYHLCRILADAGAEQFVSDISHDAVARAVEELGATPVGPEEIFRQDVEVFAPCALGGVINDNSIGQLKARVVAAAANNQLATPDHGEQLHKLDIVYAPDFLVNAGGMLSIGGSIFGDHDPSHIESRIAGLYDRNPRPVGGLCGTIDRTVRNGAGFGQRADRRSQPI